MAEVVLKGARHQTDEGGIVQLRLHKNVLRKYIGRGEVGLRARVCLVCQWAARVKPCTVTDASYVDASTKDRAFAAGVARARRLANSS